MIVFGIGIIVLLVIISIISNFTYILTEKQFKELWISSILMVILLGYIRAKILNLEWTDIFVPTFLYIIWYFLTKLSANLINKDDDVIRNINFSKYKTVEIIIATILFLFIFGYFRSMILDLPIDSMNIVTTTVLFFLWYFISTSIVD